MQGCISRAVRAHNQHPGVLTRFLRQNAAHLSFAIVVGAVVLHVTGEQSLSLAYPVVQADGTVLCVLLVFNPYCNIAGRTPTAVRVVEECDSVMFCAMATSGV
jgi:hypothetical protein